MNTEEKKIIEQFSGLLEYYKITVSEPVITKIKISKRAPLTVKAHSRKNIVQFFSVKHGKDFLGLECEIFSRRSGDISSGNLITHFRSYCEPQIAQ